MIETSVADMSSRVFIAIDQSDDKDIKLQYRSICGRANMLIRKFQRCSEQVRLVLFRAYCTAPYCAPLWRIFAKNTII